MKKYLLVLFLVAISTMMIGCNITSSGGSSGGGAEYFPNTNGNSWTFKSVGTQNTPSSATTLIATTEMTVDGTTTVDSMTVQIFRSVSTSSYGVSTSEALVLVNSNGVYTYGSVSSPSTEAITTMEFPLSVGSRWTGYGTSEVEVVAKETVTVPAGTFNNCYKLSSITGNPSQVSYLWVGPNVGFVKSFSSDISGSYTYVATMELMSKNF